MVGGGREGKVETTTTTARMQSKEEEEERRRRRMVEGEVPHDEGERRGGVAS
jgi:hypothetical protein